MSYTDEFGSAGEAPRGYLRASEMQGSLGSSLWAQAQGAFDTGIGALARIGAFNRAENGDWSLAGQISRLHARISGGMAPDLAAQVTAQESADRHLGGAFAPEEIPIDQAQARVQQDGLGGQIKLPDQPTIKAPVLNLMIADGQEAADRAAAVARGPHGFMPGALGYATAIGAGLLDPVNDAAFAVPALGEARWGKLLEGAGESLLARAGVRAAQGAVQGAAGTALLQPFDWLADTEDGHDYTFATALQNVALGAGQGGVFHAGLGAAGDVLARMRGERLTEPAQSGIPGEPSAESTEGVPGIGEGPEGAPAAISGDLVPNDHPAAMFASLPEDARADVTRSAIADVVAGRPVRTGEMLAEAAKVDPRIAQSFEAWHGSPHDFEAFDLGRIGTGEGAQSYGHGLYFAENEGVARSYQRKTSDKAFIDKVAALYDQDFSPSEAWDEVKDNWGDFSPAEQRLMTALEKDDWLGFDYPHQAVSAVLRSPQNFELSAETKAAAKAMGNMYRVRVAADREHFLDWDKPLSEQSPHVRAAVETLLPGGKTHWGFEPKTGEDFARSIGAHLGEPETWKHGENQAKASQAMREAGIAGIKYLDQRSRGRGDENGTRNYVVFDDKLIKILEKNGKRVGEPETTVRLPSARPRAPRAERRQSLLEFLLAKGGVSDEDPLTADLLQSFGGENPNIRGRGKLVRSGGLSLDRLREAAVEARYLVDHGDEHGTVATSTIRDLLDLVDREARGQKQYPIGDELAGVDVDEAHLAERNAAERELYFDQAREDIGEMMDRAGIETLRPQIRSFAVRMLERGTARNAREAFDLALDNFDVAGGREQAGDADLADWQQFERAAPAYDDPQLVAESNEAAATPEPASIDPARAPSAAERAASEAEQQLDAVRGALSDEDRQQFDDALAEMDRERDDKREIIEQGFECLAKAAA